MKFLIRLLFFAPLLFSCKPEVPSLTIDLSDQMVLPKHYIVTRCSEDIEIDGKADEPCWQSAKFSDSFIDIEGVKVPKYDTKIKMLWDDDFLYVFAQLEEPHVWGNIRKRDAVIFYNNDFEVFINPSRSTLNYGEIEINTLGTVWDLLLDKPYREGGKAINHWNLDELKSAIYVEGTVNNSTDLDSFWTVEMAIPMKVLLELKVKPQLLPTEGEQWRVNFSRVQWDHEIKAGVYQRKKGTDGKLQREYNWVWSNQNVINMHEPEKWGTIQFTHVSSADNNHFIAEENRGLEQVAYALYRETKNGELASLLKETVGSSRTINIKYTDKSSIKATFYKTNLGFEYVLKIPLSKQLFIINESGVLKKVG